MRIETFQPRAFLFLAFFLLAPIGGRASQLNIPPQATEAIRLMYSGKPDQAILLARELEAARPENGGSAYTASCGTPANESAP